MLSQEQAQKNIEAMAENVITPSFLRYIEIMGGILIGWGIGDFLKETTIITILLFICGLLLVGSAWYVRKNFEWTDPNQPLMPIEPEKK